MFIKTKLRFYVFLQFFRFINSIKRKNRMKLYKIVEIRRKLY